MSRVFAVAEVVLCDGEDGGRDCDGGEGGGEGFGELGDGDKVEAEDVGVVDPLEAEEGGSVGGEEGGDVGVGGCGGGVGRWRVCCGGRW